MIVASLLASLRHYEVAVPVRVDRYGAVIRPSTSTKQPRAERRARRSPDVGTITSPLADDDRDRDVPASDPGKCISQ